jgi:hypothetical protein
MRVNDKKEIRYGTLIACMVTLVACNNETGIDIVVPQGDVQQEKIQMTAGNTARPGIFAVREEYDAALKANTIAAWELFIARHPQSPWTADAKARLKQLQNK